MDIDLEADVEQAVAYLDKYHRWVIPRATNRAINTTARNVRTAINRHIAKETGLKVGEVKENTDITRSSFKTLRAVVTGRRRPFTLRRFVTPSKRRPGAFDKQRGVRANPWRKSRVFPGSFIIRGRRHGQPLVAVRKGKNRYPLKILYGPSIDREFNRPKARLLMNTTARQRFRINFERDLNYYVSRISR